jgi:hypothetical protein
LYPSLFLGGLWDSNPAQSATRRTSSFGGRVTPSLLAQTSDGINQLTFYGAGDFRGYTNADVRGYDTANANVGAWERYQPTLDWVVNAQVNYTRQRDLLSTLGISTSVTQINTTGVGLAPVANQPTYNQYSAAGSVQKNFGTTNQLFMILGGSVVDINYDSTTAGLTPGTDGITTTGTGRGGFWFTPQFYAYTEGSVDQRHYSTSSLDSSGYRAVGGIGSDNFGLFRGELFGGYQAEDYSSSLNNVSSSVFGGSVYYYPLPYLTLRGAVNQTLGVSLQGTAPGAPLVPIPGMLGTSTKVDTAILEASYALAQEWNARGRFGYIRTNYTNVVRTDDAWTAGGTLTYSVWRNFGVTLDYQYLQSTSNVPLQSFNRNVVTLGATYRY